MTTKEDIRRLCNKLNLSNLMERKSFYVEGLDDQMDYLRYMLEYEQEERDKNKELKNRKKSNLPKVRTSNYKRSAIEGWNIRDIKKLTWLENLQNVFIIGECGSGKTALAVDIADEALRKLHTVYYIKMDDLIEVLNTPTLAVSQRVLKRIDDADLVIVDEMMYLPISKEDARVLYKALMRINDFSSLIIICNRDPSEWREPAKGEKLISTLVDRIRDKQREIILN